MASACHYEKMVFLYFVLKLFCDINLHPYKSKFIFLSFGCCGIRACVNLFEFFLKLCFSCNEVLLRKVYSFFTCFFPHCFSSEVMLLHGLLSLFSCFCFSNVTLLLNSSFIFDGKLSDSLLRGW